MPKAAGRLPDSSLPPLGLVIRKNGPSGAAPGPDGLARRRSRPLDATGPLTRPLAQAAQPEGGGVSGEALVVGEGEGRLGQLGEGISR